jgi:carboxylesterase type B
MLKVPVIVWFYGGAYLAGSKDFGAFGEFSPIPFYDGTGPIQASASQSSAIFVAGNYRLGALGWLAGTTMGASTTATPNAGLTDQRLLLEFVQNQISKFGGDSGNVAAWGESAGAGSILHHLIAEGGSRDPLFRRALVQSAAFQWLWDPKTLESIFENFNAATSCAGKAGQDAITCLQGIDSSDILKYQEEFFTGPNCGVVGPAVDNSLIKELPATALEGGRLISTSLIDIAHQSRSFLPDRFDHSFPRG